MRNLGFEPLFMPLNIMMNTISTVSMDVTLLISRFGWFGMDAEEVARPLLNYFGAGLSIVRCTAISNDFVVLQNT